MSFGKMKIALALVLVAVAIVGSVWSAEFEAVATEVRLPIVRPGVPEVAIENSQVDVDMAVTESRMTWSVRRANDETVAREAQQCACAGCSCNGASTCPVSIQAGKTGLLFTTGGNSPYGVTVSAHNFETDNSAIDIEAMDEYNNVRRTNGVSYTVYSNYSASGVTCFNVPGTSRLSSPGFYIVFTCRNMFYDCNMRYTSTITLNPAPAPQSPPVSSPPPTPVPTPAPTPVSPPPPVSNPAPSSNAPRMDSSIAVVLAIASIALALVAL